MSTTRQIRYYSISKTNLATLLVLPETPIGWEWQGRGPLGTMTTQRPDVVTPNNPAPNVTRIVQRYLIFRLEEVRAIAFPNIPTASIETMTMRFDATAAFFDLNMEE